MRKNILIACSLLALMLVVLNPFSAASPPPAAAQGDSRTFPETGRTVSGAFLTYWNTHGGLAQQGYPISDPLPEVSLPDGKTYTVQYFERAILEAHPENPAPFDVLGTLEGVFQYDRKYPNGAPGQQASTAAGAVKFPET